MPNLGSSNLAENEDMMSKIWTNGDTIIWLSRKHCGKRERERKKKKKKNAQNEQFLLFPQCFQKLSVVDASK